MGASRQSYVIKHHWQGYSYKQKIKNLLWLFNQTIRNKYPRDLFIKDNFITPYYKRIGCKFFNEHDLKIDYEDNECWCIKCGRHFNIKKYDNYLRKVKIKKLIKQSK